jgi:hypothetical protein
MPVGFVVVNVPPHTVEVELATVKPVGKLFRVRFRPGRRKLNFITIS